MNRRKSREIAMKLLFELSINKKEYDELMDHFKEENENDIKDVDFMYIERVIKGIEENKNFIDDKIEANLKNWKINRISKVNLAILRICVYEINFEEDIPDRVSVNEAVELSKKYGEEKSYSFVNGVLGNMIKKELE